MTILYRGPLASCNYSCVYCPFAKRHETRAEHIADGLALDRFVDWANRWKGGPLSVFFTPWGEALIRQRYQQAIIALSHMPHIRRVAIQTNLSCRLDWIARCDNRSLALWTTYHPEQVSRAAFLRKCDALVQAGVRFSVGVVGLKEHFEEIEALRRELPATVYLWVNACKHSPDYYTPDDLARLECIDPLFTYNTRYYPSRGKACRCGHSVIAVDGQGNIRRCHFIDRILGNIYEPGFEVKLVPTACSRDTCHCHIGYVHMNDLGLYDIFGDGVLERIPNLPGGLKPPGR
ncbi:MAG: STM4011 family radical SAM protein [Anaerolineae bacterium]|nr:STM4011 family radical SAM protein [Anaerolineae bacterium]